MTIVPLSSFKFTVATLYFNMAFFLPKIASAKQYLLSLMIEACFCVEEGVFVRERLNSKLDKGTKIYRNIVYGCFSVVQEVELISEGFIFMLIAWSSEFSIMKKYCQCQQIKVHKMINNCQSIFDEGSKIMRAEQLCLPRFSFYLSKE